MIGSTFFKASFLGLCLTQYPLHAIAGCQPEYVFYPPTYTADCLSKGFDLVNTTLNSLIGKGVFNTTSFSLEIASSQKTLQRYYHTAETPTSRGTKQVDGSSVYRIASNTKLFTALGILQSEAAGKLRLDDSVNTYLTDLPSNGGIDWSQITVRTLLGHLGGIFDNFADLDLAASLPDPTAFGLPPVTKDELALSPQCGIFTNNSIPCSERDLLQGLQSQLPVFAPRSQSTYSNVGYDILGLVLSNVTGMKYEDAVTANILKPLAMSKSTFSKPDEMSSVIPDTGSFDMDVGVGAGSAGLYSTSSDMVKFLQYVLKNHNNITKSMNWFEPASYSPGSHSLLGNPWEIFRSGSMLNNSARAVTVVTKGGGLQGYYSYSVILPAYDLVMFMVAGGESTALQALNTIFSTVPGVIIQAAEDVAQQDLASNYAGRYAASAAKPGSNTSSDPSFHPTLNSSITISQSTDKSLYIEALTSNSTEALSMFKGIAAQQGGFDVTRIYFQFLPTFQTRQRAGAPSTVGEVWRFINVLAPSSEEDPKVWNNNDYCVSLFDPLNYAQRPLVEAIFWRGQNSTGPVDEIELTGLKIRMGRVMS